MFFTNHPNIMVPQTINNFDHVLIGLCTINHESLEIQFWKPMLQPNLIKLCPHDLLSFFFLKLHVTNPNGHHFIIGKIVHMTNHYNCLTNNTFHTIKYDLNVLQITYRLHSCDYNMWTRVSTK